MKKMTICELWNVVTNIDEIWLIIKKSNYDWQNDKIIKMLDDFYNWLIDIVECHDNLEYEIEINERDYMTILIVNTIHKILYNGVIQ